MKLNIQRFAVTKSTTFAESDVSIEGNTSTLKITIKFSPNNTSTYFSSKTLNCTCNGVKKTASVSLSKGGSVSKTFTFTGIQHNTDGTKSVSWSWSCATGTSVLGTISDSGTKALTTIQRYAKITSVSGFSTGSTIAVSYHSYSANYTYELFVQYGEEGASFKIYENIDGSVGDHTLNITVGNSYFNVYPNDTSAEIVYGITTFIDATTSYDDTYLTTIELRPNVIPSATIGTLTEADSTMQDLNWKDGNNKPIFVQNHSKLYIPVTGSGVNNSTIKKLQIYIQNQSWSKENSTSYTFTSNTLTTSGSNSIKAIATDSRNRDNNTNPTYKTFNVVEYSNPKIEIAQAQRCKQDGTLDDEGTYVKFSFKGSISPCSNHNDSTFIISYKKTTDEYYTCVNLSTAYSINLSNQISSFTISKDYTYDIKFSAVDSFTTTEIVRTLDTGFDLLNFNPSGKAMAIGKVSEAASNENLLEVALPTKFTEYVKDELVVESIRSKNMYNLQETYSWTSNNTTWYFIDGTSGAYGSDIGTKTALKVKVENGKNYSIKIGTITNAVGGQLVYDDETTIINGTNLLTSGQTFTASKNGYVLLRFRVESGKTATISKVQLEEGSSPTTYYSYQELNYNEYYKDGEILNTSNNYLYLGAVFQPPNVNATLFLTKKIPRGKTLTMTGNMRLFLGGSSPISSWTNISNLSPQISYIPDTNIVRILLVTSITSGNWQNAILNISDGSKITMS